MTAPTTPTGPLLRRRVVTGLVVAPRVPPQATGADRPPAPRRSDVLFDRGPGELAARELARHLDACGQREGRLVVPAPRLTAVRRWYRATTAQQHVGALLRGLGDGWHVLHAVPVHGGGAVGPGATGRGVDAAGVDHLLIGPGGVLVLRTAYHRGERVRVQGEQVRADGRPVDHVREVGRQVGAVAARLGPSSGHDVTVGAVVVLVGARSMQASDVPRPVTVLTDRELLGWVGQRPRRLSQVVVDRLAAAAGDPVTWGATIEPDESARRAHGQDCVATVRGSRRPASVRALLSAGPRRDR